MPLHHLLPQVAVRKSPLGRSLVAAVALAAVFGFVGRAEASPICASTTSCTLDLNQGNSSSGIGSGNFGTVDLELNQTTHVVTITVDLVAGWQIINTGFPGSFGFTDTLGGGLTIGGFSSSLYSGGTSDTTNNVHFDGFGYVNDAAATSGPKSGNGLNSVSFTVSKGSDITDVNQLVNLANPEGGDGPAYFIVDVYNGNTTGLVAADGSQSVPEPASMALLGSGMLALGVVLRRRRSAR